MSSTVRVAARTAVLALATALAALMSGCAAPGQALRVSVDAHAPEYVRGQLIDGMREAGYRKVSFRNFRSDGNLIPELRSADRSEYRFVREPFVARVFYDRKPSLITVRLDDAGDARAAELARIEQGLRTAFVSIRVH